LPFLFNFLSLIALSFKPFVVVHVNGPFTELTGRSSIGLLGKPLHEMLENDPLVTAALQTSCAQFTLASLDGQSVHMLQRPASSAGGGSGDSIDGSLSGSSRSSNGSAGSRGRKSRRHSSSMCTIRVSPIGQDGALGHITHYLLEVVQVGDKDLLEEEDSNEDEANIDPRASIRRSRSAPSSPRFHSMKVMG
jgi:hypothetical protein